MTAIVAKKKNAFNRLVTFGVILFSDCMIYRSLLVQYFIRAHIATIVTCVLKHGS